MSPRHSLLLPFLAAAALAVPGCTGDDVLTSAHADAEGEAFSADAEGETARDAAHDATVDALDSAVDSAPVTRPDGTTDTRGSDAPADSASDTGPIDAGPDAPVDTGCAVNACGTCTALAGKIGDACGTCGKLACASDNLSLVCNDTATPPVGASCTYCGTGKYTCSSATPGTTVCPVAYEDRNTNVDESFTAAIGPYSPQISPSNSVAVRYLVQHDAVSLESVTFTMFARWISDLPTASVGAVTVTAYLGSPSAPGAQLALARLPGDKVASFGTGTSVMFSFAPVSVALKAGTEIFFEIDSDSTKYGYFLDGSGGTPRWPTDELFFVGRPGTWSFSPNFAPYFTSRVLSCATF